MSEDRLITCAWCGQGFVAPSRRGPAPMYCRPSHRQAAHVERLRRRAGGNARDPRADELAELRARVEALEARLDAGTAPRTARGSGPKPVGKRLGQPANRKARAKAEER